MANVYVPRPTDGGSSGAWAPLADQQLDAALGYMSGLLYSNAGVLTIPPCRIGINDGTNLGMCVIPAATAISTSANSNSNWIAIEMAVSGASVILTATDIVGATNGLDIPSSVKAAYDGTKGAFYLNANKRLIALAWKSGTVVGIVNFIPGQNDWFGYNLFAAVGFNTITYYYSNRIQEYKILDSAVLVASTPQSLAHGLGKKPSYFKWTLLCVGADLASGCSTDDEIIQLSHNAEALSTAYGLQVIADATNFTICPATKIYALNKGSGAGTALTLASWKVRIRYK